MILHPRSSSGDQARRNLLRWRQAEQADADKPNNIIAHVEVSGTAATV
jgi:hypothetical protein